MAKSTGNINSIADAKPEISEKGSAKKILTKDTLEYLSAFASILIAGLFLENPVLIYISLVPLFLVVSGFLLSQPTSIQIKRHDIKSSCYTGETIEIETDVTVNDGSGFLILRDVIPKHFEIVEGSNFKILWKGFKPKKDTFRYAVKCTKRGVYCFEELDWEFRHALRLRQTVVGKCRDKKELIVQLRTVPLRRIRNTKTLSRLPLPLGSLAKSGITTTDFKEIREYSPGDPYKNINWKVTAQRSNGLFLQPFVNEFEKEGKKFVWIFMDGSKSMGSQGSVISNAFENAIAAVNSLSQYYLERECFVGVYIYSKKPRTILPDIGRKQRFKISKELLGVEMAEAESLRRSVQMCRSYLVGNSPLSIIITALSENKTNDLLDGIKELKKYNKSWVKSSILVLNVKSHFFAAKTQQEKYSAGILQCKDYQIESRLREAGAMVLAWDPTERSLLHVFLAEVKSR